MRASLAALVAAAAAGSPFLPLAPGQELVFASDDGGGQVRLRVAAAAGGALRLEGFPGLPAVSARWVGSTLRVWDTGDRRWEDLLRLGARRGTAHAVMLGTPLWNGVRVAVAERTDRSIRLTFSYRGLADAGLVEMRFARGTGLVGWTEQSFRGAITWRLVRGPVP